MCLGILFPPVFRNVVIFLILLNTVFLFLTDEQKKVRISFLLINSSLFITYLISFIYTDNYEIGLKKIETASSLFLFPLIFSLLPKHVILSLKINLNYILNLLTLSGIALIIISFINYTSTPGLALNSSSLIDILQNMNTVYNIDNMYRSFHLGISLICGFLLLYRYKNPYKWVYAIFLIIVVSILLFIISNKVIVAASCIALFALAFLANTKKVFVMLTLISGALFFIAVYNPNFNDKITNLFTIKDKSFSSISQEQVRDNLANCSSKLLPESGVLGYGIGDAKTELVNCYQQINSDLETLNFNTHNQYISIILISGFLGLSFFIFFLLFNIVNSLNFKNYTAVVFIIYFAIVMISENILERHDGVISFGFLVSLFISFNYTKSRNKSLTTNVVLENIKTK